MCISKKSLKNAPVSEVRDIARLYTACRNSNFSFQNFDMPLDSNPAISSGLCLTVRNCLLHKL